MKAGSVDSAFRENPVTLSRLLNYVPELAQRLKEVEQSLSPDYPIIENASRHPLDRKTNEPQSDYLKRLYAEFLKNDSIEGCVRENPVSIGRLINQILPAVKTIQDLRA